MYVKSFERGEELGMIKEFQGQSYLMTSYVTLFSVWLYPLIAKIVCVSNFCFGIRGVSVCIVTIIDISQQPNDFL